MRMEAMNRRIRFIAFLLMISVIMSVSVYTQPAYAATNTEKENNGSLRRATHMTTVNTWWSGTLENREDVDWYSFTLTEDGYISIGIQSKGDYAIDAVDVQLFSKDQKTELLSDDNGRGWAYGEFNEVYPHYITDYIGLSKGTYYIKCSAHLSANYPKDYKLKVYFKPSSVWEKEPNDGFATANIINNNTKYYFGCRDNYSEKTDYYKFKLDSKSTVSLSFQDRHGFATNLQYSIYKSDKTPIVEKQEVYCGRTKGTKTGQKTELPAGTYYLEMSVLGLSWIGLPERPPLEPEYFTFKLNVDSRTSLKAKSITVGNINNQIWTGSPITPPVVVKDGSTTLKNGTDYTVSFKNNIAVGTASATITGKGKYKDTITKTFKIVAPAKQIERVEGRNRYLTAAAIADELKASNGNKKFPAIIVATGTAHPDALAGGYLAKVKGAPIILTTPSIESDTIKYIKSNMAANGKVYILGGEIAIPNSFVTKLRSAGITNYKRLGGKSRFDTNLLILNEAGVKKGEEIVVAKGYGSAPTDAQDALIAASTGRPMLLVGQGDLTPSQKNFLNNKRPQSMTIIGSTGTVSSNTAEQLGNYGTISRIAGENIYDRSVKVGEKYYKAPKCVVLAIGDNWPDALTGGPLAVKKGGPLLLVGTSYNQYKYAKSYVKRANIYKNYTLGGTAAVPEATTREIMKR